MRAIVLLALLVCAAPSFAQSMGPHAVRACISAHSAIPVPTWFSNLGDAYEFCMARAAYTTPGAVVANVYPAFDADLQMQTTNYTFSGSRSGGTLAFSMYEYKCIEPGAWFNTETLECEGGPTDLTSDDIATYVGYILGAFAVGYAMGYGFRVFYKAVDML